MRLGARLSPTIDRFLAGHFFYPFLASLAALTMAYALGDLFNRFQDLWRYGGFGLLGLRYFLLKVPLMVAQLLPIACLTGALLGFALLNRSGEVLACQQLGVSRLEMAVPVLAVGVIVSLLDFGLNETIVPYTTREARYLYEVELKKRQLRGVFANQQIWARVREGFVAANSYDREKHELRGITLYRVVPDYRLSDVVRAPSARWDGRRWRAEGMSSLRVTSGGTVHPYSEDQLELSLRPADFEVLRRDPDEFSLWELNRYIRGLRRSGLDPGGYLVGRDLKFAAPFSCLIMVALGVALTLDPLPRTVGLGRSFGVAIAIGFCYWLALGLSSSLGRSGLLHAWVAAWLPNLAFSTVAAAIFLFGEER